VVGPGPSFTGQVCQSFGIPGLAAQTFLEPKRLTVLLTRWQNTDSKDTHTLTQQNQRSSSRMGINIKSPK
jgi:hypothetical protein